MDRPSSRTWAVSRLVSVAEPLWFEKHLGQLWNGLPARDRGWLDILSIFVLGHHQRDPGRTQTGSFQFLCQLAHESVGSYQIGLGDDPAGRRAKGAARQQEQNRRDKIQHGCR